VLFDAADTYGNGLSEELIAKAFPNQRDKIVIATKVRYDFVHYGEARGRGQSEIPQDFFVGRGYSRDRRGIESLEDAYRQEIPQIFSLVTSRRQRDLMTC